VRLKYEVRKKTKGADPNGWRSEKKWLGGIKGVYEKAPGKERGRREGKYSENRERAAYVGVARGGSPLMAAGGGGRLCPGVKITGAGVKEVQVWCLGGNGIWAAFFEVGREPRKGFWTLWR